jgi:hypothetical protein
MERANHLTDGFCLKAKSSPQYVFYREGAASVRMDLRNAPGALKAVAVDCAKGYAEVDLGTLAAADQVWTAPYASDWILAVGDFER